MRPFLEERGTWEPEEGALLSQFFRPGLRFLDVGANVGYFSLLVAQRCPGAVIHAFEPHPLTSQVLALNAWASGADITTHALALSAGDRILALTTAESNLGDTRTRAAGVRHHALAGRPARRGAAGRRLRPGQDRRPGLRDRGRRRACRDDRRSPGVVIVAEFWPSALRERGLDPVAGAPSASRMTADDSATCEAVRRGATSAQRPGRCMEPV